MSGTVELLRAAGLGAGRRVFGMVETGAGAELDGGGDGGREPACCYLTAPAVGGRRASLVSSRC